MRARVTLFAAAAGLAAAGCASPRPPAPAADGGAEEARREERLKLLRQYWIDETESLPEEPGSGAGAGPLLDYPAGDYGGIRFAPRRAADPSLGEPER